MSDSKAINKHKFVFNYPYRKTILPVTLLRRNISCFTNTLGITSDIDVNVPIPKDGTNKHQLIALAHFYTYLMYSVLNDIGYKCCARVAGAMKIYSSDYYTSQYSAHPELGANLPPENFNGPYINFSATSVIPTSPNAITVSPSHPIEFEDGSIVPQPRPASTVALVIGNRDFSVSIYIDKWLRDVISAHINSNDLELTAPLACYHHCPLYSIYDNVFIPNHRCKVRLAGIRHDRHYQPVFPQVSIPWYQKLIDKMKLKFSHAKSVFLRLYFLYTLLLLFITPVASYFMFKLNKVLAITIYLFLNILYLPCPWYSAILFFPRCILFLDDPHFEMVYNLFFWSLFPFILFIVVQIPILKVFKPIAYLISYLPQIRTLCYYSALKEHYLFLFRNYDYYVTHPTEDVLYKLFFDMYRPYPDWVYNCSFLIRWGPTILGCLFTLLYALKEAIRKRIEDMVLTVSAESNMYFDFVSPSAYQTEYTGSLRILPLKFVNGYCSDRYAFYKSKDKFKHLEYAPIGKLKHYYIIGATTFGIKIKRVGNPDADIAPLLTVTHTPDGSLLYHLMMCTPHLQDNKVVSDFIKDWNDNFDNNYRGIIGPRLEDNEIVVSNGDLFVDEVLTIFGYRYISTQYNPSAHHISADLVSRLCQDKLSPAFLEVLESKYNYSRALLLKDAAIIQQLMDSSFLVPQGAWKSQTFTLTSGLLHSAATHPVARLINLSKNFLTYLVILLYYQIFSQGSWVTNVIQAGVSSICCLILQILITSLAPVLVQSSVPSLLDQTSKGPCPSPQPSHPLKSFLKKSVLRSYKQESLDIVQTALNSSSPPILIEVELPLEKENVNKTLSTAFLTSANSYLITFLVAQRWIFYIPNVKIDLDSLSPYEMHRCLNQYPIQLLQKSKVSHLTLQQLLNKYELSTQLIPVLMQSSPSSSTPLKNPTTQTSQQPNPEPQNLPPTSSTNNPTPTDTVAQLIYQDLIDASAQSSDPYYYHALMNSSLTFPHLQISVNALLDLIDSMMKEVSTQVNVVLRYSLSSLLLQFKIYLSSMDINSPTSTVVMITSSLSTMKQLLKSLSQNLDPMDLTAELKTLLPLSRQLTSAAPSFQNLESIFKILPNSQNASASNLNDPPSPTSPQDSLDTMIDIDTAPSSPPSSSGSSEDVTPNSDEEISIDLEIATTINSTTIPSTITKTINNFFINLRNSLNHYLYPRPPDIGGTITTVRMKWNKEVLKITYPMKPLMVYSNEQYMMIPSMMVQSTLLPTYLSYLPSILNLLPTNNPLPKYLKISIPICPIETISVIDEYLQSARLSRSFIYYTNFSCPLLTYMPVSTKTPSTAPKKNSRRRNRNRSGKFVATAHSTQKVRAAAMLATTSSFARSLFDPAHVKDYDPKGIPDIHTGYTLCAKQPYNLDLSYVIANAEYLQLKSNTYSAYTHVDTDLFNKFYLVQDDNPFIPFYAIIIGQTSSGTPIVGVYRHRTAINADAQTSYRLICRSLTVQQIGPYASRGGYISAYRLDNSLIFNGTNDVTEHAIDLKQIIENHIENLDGISGIYSILRPCIKQNYTQWKPYDASVTYHFRDEQGREIVSHAIPGVNFANSAMSTNAVLLLPTTPATAADTFNFRLSISEAVEYEAPSNIGNLVHGQPRVIDFALALTSELPNFYPASFNDLKKILGKIKQAYNKNRDVVNAALDIWAPNKSNEILNFLDKLASKI